MCVDDLLLFRYEGRLVLLVDFGVCCSEVGKMWEDVWTLLFRGNDDDGKYGDSVW